jgi:hypothetical protein
MDYYNLFRLPNEEILKHDFDLSVKEQQELFLYYMKSHLFDKNTHLVAQKFFKNAASKLVLEKSFEEKELISNPNHILAAQAYIPVDYFKRFFGLTTNYQFPTLLIDQDGIFTGKIPKYAKFDHFKFIKSIEEIGVRFLLADSSLIRDINIEKFIMVNQITHIQLNLKSQNLSANYVSNNCTIYPEIIRTCSDVYDTVYLTDYILKYIYNILVKMMIYERSSHDTKIQTFLIGHRNIDGFYKVSNLVGHGGFLKLLNTVQLFILKNKLKGNVEIKESYAKYGESTNELSIYINYENITFGSEKIGNEYYVQLQPLEVKPVMTYKVSDQYAELPLFATYIRQFVAEYYNDIKLAFPIFERLENIYRLCGLVGIMSKIVSSDDLDNFTMVQHFRENKDCVLADTYASSIMTSGGLVLMPNNYVKVPYIPISEKPIPKSEKATKSECREAFDNAGFICAFAPKLQIRECYDKNLKAFHECLSLEENGK